MRNFLYRFFSRINNLDNTRINNLDNISRILKELSYQTPVSKIFEAINSYSTKSEIRYVGGCVRKILKNEDVDDIDLATNLDPKEICEALKRYEINYHEIGIEHGTITALIDKHKFEITSLREDVSTDGRHAKVKFSNDWKKDALRRDFTINSIYSDKDGNLFDPFNGIEDLKNGEVNFIGDPEKRIKEDYLRILRYLRFFLIYSKKKHKDEIKSFIKKNLVGISKLSKERLLDELKKILKTEILLNLSKDRFSLEIINIIFPELKYFNIFSKLNSHTTKILKEIDFILVISLLIIDETDNSDYFLYKFNVSKKNQKRIKNINEFFRENSPLKNFNEKILNKVLYYKGKETVLDILIFRIFKTKKIDRSLINLFDLFKNKEAPIMPIKADNLISNYNISEGKFLGDKLKVIEEAWVNNNFKISDKQVENIIKN
tara:strand:+ start:690 stop:1988 length:1299 start_codon:yes stop_codon:yes gene_type:complete